MPRPTTKPRLATLDAAALAKDVEARIDRYLGADDERARIAHAGCELVRREHQFQQRIRTILGVLRPEYARAPLAVPELIVRPRANGTERAAE